MIRVKEYNKTLSLGVRYLATKGSVVKKEGWFYTRSVSIQFKFRFWLS